MRSRAGWCLPDQRNLAARFNEAGDLMIVGQDLGPGTAPVSSCGEYEWFRTVRHEHNPEPLALLGGEPDRDLLALLLEAWSGQASDGLERLIQQSGIPNQLYVWSS